MKDKYLIIGGSGFIGQNLANKLKQNNEHIIIADRSYTSTDENYCEFKFMDFYSENDFDIYMDGVKAVVFLVCNVNAKSSMDMPDLCYDRNIIQLIKLLDSMRRMSVNQMVFVSSGGTVYGNGYTTPINEESSTNPLSHYGVLKLAQEKIIQIYNQIYGMNNIIFRVANPYGPGQRVDSGVGVVTAFVKKLLSNDSVALVGNGKDVVRDYLHIDDVCTMIYRVLKVNETSEDRTYCVFNIGSGIGYTVYDVLCAVEEALEKKAKVECLPCRNSDVGYNVLDINRVVKYIGGYECMSLIDGIRKYIKQLESI